MREREKVSFYLSVYLENEQMSLFSSVLIIFNNQQIGTDVLTDKNNQTSLYQSVSTNRHFIMKLLCLCFASKGTINASVDIFSLVWGIWESNIINTNTKDAYSFGFTGMTTKVKKKIIIGLLWLSTFIILVWASYCLCLYWTWMVSHYL